MPGREDIVLKLLSVDPSSYDDAPAEGIRRVLENVSGKQIPRGSPIPKDSIHSIRMGTTVATNGGHFTLDFLFSFPNLRCSYAYSVVGKERNKACLCG